MAQPDFDPTTVRFSPRVEAAKYANGVVLNLSPFDLTIEFVHQAPVGVAPQGGQVPMQIIPAAKIVMSPQHAKALLFAIGQSVAQWESQFGELPDQSGNFQQSVSAPPQGAAG